MKKIGSLFTFLCIVNLLAVVGLVGFLYGSGRLDRTKAGAIADMLKHKGTPDNFREQLYDIMEPATTSAPASRAAGTQRGAVVETGMSADEKLAESRRAVDKERLELEDQAQDLRRRPELLVQLNA